MGRLFLIRHAQASFLQADYDRLSPCGEAQARQLGEYWAKREVVFDQMCSGPRVRQKGTAQLVRDAYAGGGLSLPALAVLPEFDEYDGESVLTRGIPKLIQTDTQVRSLHEAFHASATGDQRFRSFQKLFEAVTGRWVDGSLRLEGVEDWSEFCRRVNSGLSQILGSSGKSERIAVFTSGGPIAVAMQRALALSPQRTLSISWMSRNSSWSEFLFDRERFTLSAFNSHPHLDDAALLTYR